MELKSLDLSLVACQVEDRMNRNTNFVISGVAESTSSSPVLRKEEDKSKCADILEAAGLNDDSVEVFRID